MATNEILKFCSTDTGTNLLTQSAYNASAGSANNRNVGNTAGEYLLSELVNKVLRQTSTVAAGVAKFLADNQGTNVTDALTADQIAVIMTNAIAARINPILTSYVQGPASATNNVLAVFDGTTGKLLKNSTMLISDVTKGAASSTDNAIARFDSTTGKLIQNSSATLSDDGVLKSTNSLSGDWATSQFIAENTASPYPQITLHAPTVSKAMIIEFDANSDILRLLSGNKSFYYKLAGQSIGTTSGTATGGLGGDLTFNFENRLQHTFTATNSSQRVWAFSNFGVVKNTAGQAAGVLCLLRLYNVTTSTIIHDSVTSYCVNVVDQNIADLSCSMMFDGPLVSGNQYRIELQIRKDLAVSAAYQPRAMKINYTIW